MMYCEECKDDMFGGSICHHCGGPLVAKVVNTGPKIAHVSSDVIMGKKKNLTVDSAQSLSGRLFRLVIEIALFCFLFYAIAYIVAGGVNWLSKEMSMNPETAPPAIDIESNAFKYFRYIGVVIVGLITIRFRFQPGK